MNESIPIVKPEQASAPQQGIQISKPTNPQVTPVATQAPKPTNTITIELPSKGWFYDPTSPLASGKVEISQITAKHEDIINSQKLVKSGKCLDELLKSLIVTTGVSLDDILVGDKNKIFCKVREEMYGSRYDSKIKCTSCGEETIEKIDLSLLKDKELNFDSFSRGQNRFEYELPLSKKRITWRLLNHKIEESIDSELQALSKFSKSGLSPEMTTRLKMTILEVDGNSDRNVIKKFVDEMSSRDSLEFRKHIKLNSPDIDLAMEFKCPNCSHQERMNIQLGISFFWPSTEV